MAETKEPVPTLAKISGLLVLGGFILFMIGFGTHFWSYSEVYGYATEGLWLGCYKSDCKPIFDYGPLPAWFIATQVLECLGAVAALGAVGSIIIYIFAGERTLCIVSTVACFLSSGSGLIGVIIYGATVQENLSWSFAFSIIGAIFLAVAGVILIVTRSQRSKKQGMDMGRNPEHEVPLSDVKVSES